MCSPEKAHDLKSAALRFLDTDKRYSDLTPREQRCVDLAQALNAQIDLLLSGAPYDRADVSADLAASFQTLGSLADAGILEQTLTPKNLKLLSETLRGITDVSQSVVRKTNVHVAEGVGNVEIHGNVDTIFGGKK